MRIRYEGIASACQLFVLTRAFWVYEVFYPEGGVTFLVIVNWGSVRSRALPLKPLDTQFAQQLVNKQAATLCTDLGFNVCGIDVRGATGSLDLLGYFTKCFHAASMNHADSYSLRPTLGIKNFINQELAPQVLCKDLSITGTIHRELNDWVHFLL